jgi:hypothetical protein
MLLIVLAYQKKNRFLFYNEYIVKRNKNMRCLVVRELLLKRPNNCIEADAASQDATVEVSSQSPLSWLLKPVQIVAAQLMLVRL